MVSMPQSRKFGWRTLSVMLAALACAGSWAVGQVRGQQDSALVARMTGKMKPVCVGRYLIDVPGEAETSLSGEMISGFTIDTVEETESAFHARMSAREAEIEARGEDGNSDGEGGLVEARDLQVPGLVGRSFIYGRSRGYLMAEDRRIDMESFSVEAHAHIGGFSFSLSAKGTEVGSAREAEALLARLRLRREDEIPAVPGFCIWRGLFAEPLPTHKTEHVTLRLGLPAHPDMGLALESIAGRDIDSSLLERVADADAEASVEELLRVTKLRLGQRTINGIDGEEVLERVRESNFTTGYNFMWEAAGVKDDLLQPYLLLNMETGTNPRPGGKPVDSSLHEDAVLALWDSVSSSIRLRKSDPAPSKATADNRKNP